jgi:hypothetical protein
MSGHSTLGPSSAERWLNCPGSVALCATQPAQKASVYAAEGSVAHALAEDLVTGKADVLTLAGRLGEIVKQEGHDIEVTDEMVDGAILYHDTIKVDLDAMRAVRKPAPVASLVEKRICASSVDKELWGTLDHGAYRKGDVLHIHDYKYGKGKPVEVEDNWQLIIYAIALMDSEASWAFDRVVLTIVQPRAPHADGPVRSAEYTVAQLRAFREELIAGVAATKQKNAKVAAGTWCRWCAAKAVCPAMYAAAQKEASVDFDVVPAAGAVKGLPDVRMMPVVALGKALEWEDAINSWYEAVRLVVREKLEAGEEVPGWKLVDGRANRKWVDEAAVESVFGPVLGDKLYETKLLSPAKLEKLVGKGKLVDGTGADLTFKPQAAKTIAPSGDARLEARTTASEDFDRVLGVDVTPGNTTTVRGRQENGVTVVTAIEHTPTPTGLDELLTGGAEPAKAAADDLMAELLGPTKKEPIWPQ